MAVCSEVDDAMARFFSLPARSCARQRHRAGRFVNSVADAWRACARSGGRQTAAYKRALRHVFLIVVSYTAASGVAGADEPTQAYACVDPTDAMARRRMQDEPCQLPLLHMPVSREPAVNPATRWPSYRSRFDADGAHPMFWRFPVQPVGPHGVPRHSWR
jgi:hypothetical protein